MIRAFLPFMEKEGKGIIEFQFLLGEIGCPEVGPTAPVNGEWKG